jgi:hypothetical protein
MKNNPSSEEALADLASRKPKIIDTSHRIIKTANGAIFPWDMIVMAAVKRSLGTIDGYTSLIHAHNFICAAAIGRLHLDTALRLFAGSLVTDPHEFAKRIMEGEHVRGIKDKHGQQMTDNYLVRQLSTQCEWVSSVYSRASGYIHLSDMHVWNTFIADDGTGQGSMAMTSTDAFIDDKIRSDTTIGMIAITDLIVDCLVAWAYQERESETKGRPCVAAWRPQRNGKGRLKQKARW